jgi:hypothetical protein
MGDVIGADHDDDEVRRSSVLDRIRELALQIRGFGSDHRTIGEFDPTTQQGGHAGRDDRADGLLWFVRAETSRRAVPMTMKWMGSPGPEP